ncbi:antibiotic biosynthesis monooxygenase [Sphaerisporangium sp. TRM90804]|uniref:antibiotic biosynthesis monooxygenase family protein n=1 Tax=Sphaerisporangium sp. TRM90804 TaxID=3031113 RepID=UPI00244714FF|nr:antibiotic biosynthesis monooxygenase [Sphaerisporangium sp. TRM90804]MDH2427211.1 antibiotic biosynthesis monooxygenase [Sphaerisporangium sp. TRM90804]
MSERGEGFRVLLRMQIHPGMEQDFEKAWYSIGDVITTHPANLGQWLMAGLDEPGVYYIVSDWVDEPRFREFEHSAEHVEHRQKLHPYRASGSMATMRIVYHLRGAAEGAPRATGARAGE